MINKNLNIDEVRALIEKCKSQEQLIRIFVQSLKPYLDAGLLTSDLKPVPGLSNGQIAMLAHDIAKRLKMEKFWPLFEDYWRVRNLRTYNSMFSTTAKSVTFWKRLNKIK